MAFAEALTGISEKRMTSLLNTRSGAMMIDFGIETSQKIRRSGGSHLGSALELWSRTPQDQIVFNVLDSFFERTQKARARRTVNHLMVAGQRQADRVNESDSADVAHRLHVDRPDAEDGDLRHIDHRR